MDKRELKEEIDAASTINHSNLLHYTKEGMSWRNDNIVINKGKLFDLIDQLDEPEVLSTDWIKDNQSMWTSIHGAEYYVPANKLYGKLVPKQEEAEKVVVPEFVGEWIEECKRGLKSLYGALKGPGGDGKLEEWLFISPNQKTFARAWLDGYTVKEKTYRVLDKEGCVLIRRYGETVRRVTSKVEPNEYPESKRGVLALTEQEIKDYDERFWPFAVPVEEEEK